MPLSRSARPLSVSALLLAAACGGSTPAPEAAPVATAAPTAEPAGPTAGVARDPKLAEMAKAARACGKGEKAYDFDSDCGGYKAWHDNDEAFADGKADDTLFSMLGDPDPKVHYLARMKPIQPAHWKDKGHAKGLFALARDEKDGDVLRTLAEYAAIVDVEAAGLGAELKDFTKHPSPAFRKELAMDLVQRSQTPLALEVEQLFLADAERDVKEAAIIGLGHEKTPPTEPVCALLAKQIARTDDELDATAINVASSSKCPGLKERALAEVDKRTADPTKVTLRAGRIFSSVLFGACYGADAPEKKKKAFALAERLVDPRIPESMVREGAVDTLFACDWAALDKIMPRLAKDKPIADHLKRVQDSIKERKASAAKGKKK